MMSKEHNQTQEFELKREDLYNYLSSQHMIAFLDILGSADAIMHDEFSFFSSVYELFGTSKALCEQFGEQLHFSNIKIKAFSDNIIFVQAIPPHCSYVEQCSIIGAMSFFTSMFQFLALSKGILIRGGITVGSLCFNETFVWGKALVEAYRMENIYAIYPRVLVSPDIVKLLVNENSHPQCSIRMLQDIDGQIFLDFLSCMHQSSRPWLISYVRGNIQRMQSKYADNIKVLQKYAWLETYLHRFQDENNITEEMIKESVEADQKLHQDILAGSL